MTGGVRAGKSRYALTTVESLAPAGRITFVATASAGDAEMEARIARHRAERGPRYHAFEEPLDPARALEDPDSAAFVVDCLTLWISNLLFHPGSTDAWVAERVEHLAEALAGVSKPVVVVTNEVGLGIIPAEPVARRYLDLLGRANQRVGAVADRVDLVVAGLPLRVR